MSARYDFWVADLDGTIVDVRSEYIHDVMDRVGDRLGVRFSQTEAERIWRGFRGEPERLLRSRGIEPATFWRTYHGIEDPAARAAATYLYPDAQAIAELRVPVGLVTHCQPDLVEPVLTGLGISDWFDTIVCCNDDLGWKPDPRPVRHAMAALGHSSTVDEGVLVGDTSSDVGAAWNAGLDAVHVERFGADRRGCCVRADLRVNALDELDMFAPRLGSMSDPVQPTERGYEAREDRSSSDGR